MSRPGAWSFLHAAEEAMGNKQLGDSLRPFPRKGDSPGNLISQRSLVPSLTLCVRGGGWATQSPSLALGRPITAYPDTLPSPVRSRVRIVSSVARMRKWKFRAFMSLVRGDVTRTQA